MQETGYRCSVLGLPWWSIGEDSTLQVEKFQVLSLAGELWSHMAHGQEKKGCSYPTSHLLSQDCMTHPHSQLNPGLRWPQERMWPSVASWTQLQARSSSSRGEDPAAPSSDTGTCRQSSTWALWPQHTEGHTDALAPTTTTRGLSPASLWSSWSKVRPSPQCSPVSFLYL